MPPKKKQRIDNAISHLPGGSGASVSRRMSLAAEKARFEQFCKEKAGIRGGPDALKDACALCNYKMFDDYANWLATCAKVLAGKRQGQGLA